MYTFNDIYYLYVNDTLYEYDIRNPVAEEYDIIGTHINKGLTRFLNRQSRRINLYEHIPNPTHRISLSSEVTISDMFNSYYLKKWLKREEYEDAPALCSFKVGLYWIIGASDISELLKYAPRPLMRIIEGPYIHFDTYITSGFIFDTISTISGQKYALNVDRVLCFMLCLRNRIKIPKWVLFSILQLT